ncbi:MAG: hypothetical protein Q9217_006776 [Psora testacea]
MAALPMLLVDAIGVTAGIVSVGMMIPSLLPKEDEHQTVVRVAAGLSSNEDDTTAGNQPGIGLYDIVGRQIGTTHGSGQIIKDGDFIDISVPFNKGVGKKPTEYISVTDGGDDALCIAYIAITQPDGTKKAWYGDLAKTCGAPWYHSLLKTGDDDYQPSCIWIDRNRSNGTCLGSLREYSCTYVSTVKFRIRLLPFDCHSEASLSSSTLQQLTSTCDTGLPYQGLGIHITDFAATEARAKQYDENRDLMCKAAPRFRMYENMNSADTIPYFDPPLEYVDKDLTDVDPKAVMDMNRWKLPKEGKNINNGVIHSDPKPKLLRRQTHAMNSTSTVIISTSPNHSAKELCNSPSSWGYDFVSVAEQLFCDMSERQLWPVCGVKKRAGCFDRETSTMKPLIGSGLSIRDRVSAPAPPKKSYGKTLHWD